MFVREVPMYTRFRASLGLNGKGRLEQARQRETDADNTEDYNIYRKLLTHLQVKKGRQTAAPTISAVLIKMLFFFPCICKIIMTKKST